MPACPFRLPLGYPPPPAPRHPRRRLGAPTRRRRRCSPNAAAECRRRVNCHQMRVNCHAMRVNCRAPARPANSRRRPPRGRSHCHFRNRGTDYVSDSGMKWMSSSTKRQCDRARRPPAASRRLACPVCSFAASRKRRRRKPARTARLGEAPPGLIFAAALCPCGDSILRAGESEARENGGIRMTARMNDGRMTARPSGLARRLTRQARAPCPARLAPPLPY